MTRGNNEWTKIEFDWRTAIWLCETYEQLTWEMWQYEAIKSQQIVKSSTPNRSNIWVTFFSLYINLHEEISQWWIFWYEQNHSLVLMSCFSPCCRIKTWIPSNNASNQHCILYEGSGEYKVMPSIIFEHAKLVILNWFPFLSYFYVMI